MENHLFFREFYKRNLPHFQPENGLFFITTRIANSLPMKVIVEIKNQKHDFEQFLEHVEENKKQLAIREFHKHYFKRFDELLDNNNQNRKWLMNPDIQQIIKQNFMHWNKIRYNLITYCIMPNHLHLVIRPLIKSSEIYESLAKIMFSIKSYAANECNKILDRKGQFWQHESYDHYIRNNDELNFYVNYILQNPVKAGLVNKPEHWKSSWLMDNLYDIQI